MSPTIHDSKFPHLDRMMEIQREINVMSVFKIFNGRYWKLKSEYNTLQRYGFALGIDIALNDLEKAGIITRLTNKE